jgi:biotin synthase-related radical SAM superfamily protein
MNLLRIFSPAGKRFKIPQADLAPRHMMKSTLGLHPLNGKAAEVPKLRVSTGTAIALGLLDGKTDVVPTTAYLMTYRGDKCTANCSFCSQAKTSTSHAEMLSRISWPAFETKDALGRLGSMASKGIFRRICIQALNYPSVFDDLSRIIRLVKGETGVPISVSCQPSEDGELSRLGEAGVDTVGIPIDAATESVFDETKGKSVGGPYHWPSQFRILATAVSVLGKNRVSTHLIVGLGEKEQEMVETIQKCVDMGVLPALFAFTPVPGTGLERRASPKIATYRRIQLARWIIVGKLARFEDMTFGDHGQLIDHGVDNRIISSLVRKGEAFRTSGCQDCNRPFYNERPSGPIYNYPRRLTKKDISVVCAELEHE